MTTLALKYSATLIPFLPKMPFQFVTGTHRERGVMMPGDIRGFFMGEM